MTYAKDTSVSVARSRAEIEDTVTRYGASTFGSMVEDGRAAVVFQCAGRRVMLDVPLPKLGDFEVYKKRTGYGHTKSTRRTPEQQRIALEQACRQRWRALALVVKAKLEAVEAGITTFEDEFLAHIVLPDGKTVGGWMRPQLEAAYERGKMPPLLPAAGGGS